MGTLPSASHQLIDSNLDARGIQQRELEIMNAALSPIKPQKYGKLLARDLLRLIRTEAENERMLTLVKQLMAKGKSLTPEEGELLKLIGRLIADFEERSYKLGDAEPHEILRELMAARGLKQPTFQKFLGQKSELQKSSMGSELLRRKPERWHSSSTYHSICSFELPDRRRHSGSRNLNSSRQI